jgi:NADPH:quinone reductase-like Zn-dependent oxidoreductase
MTNTTHDPPSEMSRATTHPATMLAIVQDRYGEADDVLRLGEIDRPAIDDDEALVRVRAAGVDRGVWHLMTGRAYLIRLAGYGIRKPKTRVRGREVAGTIVAVGKGVTTRHVGEEVFGIAEGSFAQYASARVDKLAPKPPSLSFEQAAAVPVSALTALQALRDRGQVKAGQKVLIIGASGGVGTYAVQIAKALGAEVTGVCSTAKVDLVKAIGADHVIDYTHEDIANGEHRYEVILDIAGNRPLPQLRRALTSRGTLVLVGGEAGGKWLGGMDRVLRTVIRSLFVCQQLRTLIVSENADDLLVLTELIESGSVTPVVDRTYPLKETATAVGYMQDGHARGKVVIIV